MIEIVHNPNAIQKYHVRITSSGNGNKLTFGENLTSEEAALVEILALAKEFGIENAEIINSGGEYWLSDTELRMRAPILVIHTPLCTDCKEPAE
jgi:hypothetical protein